MRKCFKMVVGITICVCTIGMNGGAVSLSNESTCTVPQRDIFCFFAEIQSNSIERPEEDLPVASSHAQDLLQLLFQYPVPEQNDSAITESHEPKQIEILVMTDGSPAMIPNHVFKSWEVSHFLGWQDSPLAHCQKEWPPKHYWSEFNKSPYSLLEETAGWDEFIRPKPGVWGFPVHYGGFKNRPERNMVELPNSQEVLTLLEYLLINPDEKCQAIVALWEQHAGQLRLKGLLDQCFQYRGYREITAVHQLSPHEYVIVGTQSTPCTGGEHAGGSLWFGYILYPLHFEIEYTGFYCYNAAQDKYDYITDYTIDIASRQVQVFYKRGDYRSSPPSEWDVIEQGEYNLSALIERVKQRVIRHQEGKDAHAKESRK